MNIKKTVWVIVEKRKPVKLLDCLRVYTSKYEAKIRCEKNQKVKKAYLEVFIDS